MDYLVVIRSSSSSINPPPSHSHHLHLHHNESSESSMDDLSSLLATLSPAEQSIIRPVLERDLEFQRREKERIESIKAEVVVERKVRVGKCVDSLGLTVPTHRGSSSSGLSSGESFGSQASLGSSNISPISPLGIRNCNDCCGRLGMVFNSGVRCIRCEGLLCELCRVFPDNERNGCAYCKKCYRHREVLAASGEWMGIQKDQSISATILTKMRRESEDRARSPEQFRTRNMSLPPISGTNLLGLPTEERPQSQGDKFWKGSPSPRSPFSPYQLGLPHANEAIGSPSPRPLTPNSQPHHFIHQNGVEMDEEMDEDEMGAFPSLDNTRERRLSWSTDSTKRRIGRFPSKISSDIQDEDVRMRRIPLGRGGSSNSMRSSVQSDIGSKDSRAFSSQFDSISIGSFNSTEDGMSGRYQVISASLSISILSCSHLPNLDGQIKPNPYVKIILVRKGAIEPRIKHKTRSKRATNDPEFNYEIQVRQ